MGLYNTYQISVLKEQLHDTVESHNCLVEEVEKQGNSISNLEWQMSELTRTIIYVCNKSHVYNAYT
jgi:hypothetical protein